MAIEYPDLGVLVTQELDKLGESGIPSRFFMEQLAAPLGLNGYNSVSAYAHPIRHGNYYGTDSNSPQNPKEGLERLAIFLYALGFSEEDKRYGGVIGGVREKAKERGNTFEYPPPEDKRVSLDEIKERYAKQNSTIQGTKEMPEGNKTESLADRVNRLLTMPISDNPGYKISNHMIAREAYIVNISYDHLLTRTVIKIGVSSGQEDAGEWYRVSYPGNLNGNGSGAFMALKQFLLDAKRQKFRIVFRYQSQDGRMAPVVQMLAPVGGGIAYVRYDGILQQYDIGKNLLVKA